MPHETRLERVLSEWAPRHTRSMGFLDSEEMRWACYLVTCQTAAHRWVGHLTFREDGTGGREVRTAELFIEATERAIETRARQLGRPLLRGLLASAQTLTEGCPVGDEGSRAEGPAAAWVGRALGARRRRGSETSAPSGSEAGALLADAYEAYKVDQVTHLVSMLGEEVLEDVVQTLLEGEAFTFGARDELQFALLVVQKLEALLPLPPLDQWQRDRDAHPATYARYHHDLHGGLLDSQVEPWTAEEPPTVSSR